MLARIGIVQAVLALAVLARTVPQNIQDFYNAVKPGKCTGSNLLQGGFHDTGGNDAGDWTYCQQYVQGNAIFIKGDGVLANMDVDCDGAQYPRPDNRCASSQDTQSETAFKSTVQTYGISDLNANIHSYVVFGNQGTKKGYQTFFPRNHGIEPLSVMAVVCGTTGPMFYGVWGDTNGDDGPSLVGEASLALATLCFGKSMNGNNGHDPADVLYIAFVGNDTTPGANGADWKAQTPDEFEDSLGTLGDKLVARIPSITGSSTTTSSTPTQTCAWKGHCAGASCSNDNDCSGSLVCVDGKCAASQAAATATTSSNAARKRVSPLHKH